MSLRKIFGTDAKKANEGVEVTYSPNEDGTLPTFVIAHMGKTNKAYSRELEKQTKPYRAQIQAGRFDNEQAERIYLDVFLKTILRDWKNVQLSDVTGNVEDVGFAEFNEENARRLFKNLPYLYEDLQAKANAGATFSEELAEGDAKNS